MDVDEGSFLTISIHAPHMGSDLGRRTGVVLLSIISIHTPRMGSNDIRERADAVRNISIHAPRGGSDSTRSGADFGSVISIHVPRGGSDCLSRIQAVH